MEPWGDAEVAEGAEPPPAPTEAELPGQHTRLAAVAAAAAGGGELHPLTHNLLNSGGLYAHLGVCASSISLSDGAAAPEEEAAQAAAALSTAGVLYAAPPEACGQAVTWVSSACKVAEGARARASAPLRPRHGWAAASGAELRLQASAAHLPLANAVVILHRGQVLASLDAQPGTPLAAVQRAAAAWAELHDFAKQRGVASPGQLCGALHAGDTLASLASQLVLLPLADQGGFPALGLYTTRVVLTAAASSPAAAAALAQLSLPGQAWRWVQEHATQHAADPAALEFLGGWSAAHRSLAISVVSGSTSVGLADSAALPIVRQGWGPSSWLAHLSAAADPGCVLLLAAPSAKRGKLPVLSPAAVELAASAQGYSLTFGPSELPQTLNSRSGCQMIALAPRSGGGGGGGSGGGSGGNGDGRLARLLNEFAATSHTPCLVVDVSSWHRSLSHLFMSYANGLPTPAINQLAACLREAVERGRLLRRMQLAAGAAPEEEAEEEDGELTQAAVSAALQQEGIGAAMQLCALGGGGIDDAAAFAEQLMASFGGDSQGGGGGQGGGGQDDSDPAVRKCAEQLHAAVLQLRRQQQQQQTAAGAPGGVPPGGGGGWCIFFFGRASSTESPGGLGSTLGGQVAILGAAAVALLGIKAGSELLIRIQVWLETCSTYQHPPADRSVLVAMLAAARPGDVVVVASQCRLARQPAQLRAILQVARELGVSVLVAAVGSLPAPLLAALEHDGLLADTPHTAEQRRVVAATAAGAAAASQRAWALSAQQGRYTCHHAFQQRVQVSPLLPDHPVCRALAFLLHGRRVILCARVSHPERSGGAHAGAGAAAGGTLTSGSLSRQVSTLSSLLSALAASVGQRTWNGVAISGVAAQQNPALQLLGSSPLPPRPAPRVQNTLQPLKSIPKPCLVTA
ncbi:hypothetical protein C2E20_0762 [Micractinium conductrix]|uniref:Resolvase/invertase-type recombinase catalytic domain-containing protein n=1 Tax=Micractinium conductrix TaxID=554055 RepID=A0A2P6VR43_9CHLO|nr:hypothetical protein C2E20_0762 [Micractinium conductrix]|eukprot:PSC76535.1 hypothetical protein C2E20_0762 [Micractinium conductrix]